MNFPFQLRGGKRGTFSEKSPGPTLLTAPEAYKKLGQKARKNVKRKDPVKELPFTQLGGLQMLSADNSASKFC